MGAFCLRWHQASSIIPSITSITLIIITIATSTIIATACMSITITITTTPITTTVFHEHSGLLLCIDSQSLRLCRFTDICSKLVFC